MNNNTTFAVIAIVSALAMFGVVMVTVATTMQLQQAEAAKSITGQCASFFKNSTARNCH
jgi:hypothetical protein